MQDSTFNTLLWWVETFILHLGVPFREYAILFLQQQQQRTSLPLSSLSLPPNFKDRHCEHHSLHTVPLK